MHYGRLNFFGDTWLIDGLPPHVSMRFKQVFPRVPQHTVGTFRLSDSSPTCADLVWFLQRFPLEMTDATRDRLARGHADFLDIQRQAELVLSGEWTPGETPGFRPERPPYPFQAQAADLAAVLRRLLLMDDVGLGKTISALAGIARAKAFPAAVVVQAHLADQWVEEYIEPFTTMSAHIIKGRTPYRLPPADIYVFRYSNIAGWTDIAASGRFKAVIFDEVQELRHGAQTKKGEAAKAFLASNPLCMGLTATPIYNYGEEIWNVLEFVSPGALGSFFEFSIEWCKPHGSHYLVKEPAALGTYLRDQNLALRRTEHDVGKQMPPVNTLLQNVDYAEEVVAEVEAEAAVLAQRVLRGSFTDRGQAARELDMMARMATGMAKAKTVAALVRMLVESGEKVLLAGWHRDVYRVWLEELKDLKPVMYTGSETSSQKNHAKKAFIDGTTDILIISLRSGAGLDGLQTVCRTVVIGELDWSPQVHKQLIGRLRRPGQNNQVDAIYAIANGGSDPVIVEMLGLKASQSHGITDPTMSAGHAPDPDDTRVKKLAEAYLAKKGQRHVA